MEDVDKTYEELKAKGINFVMPPAQRDGEGIRLAVAVDPDGLPISFAQLLPDDCLQKIMGSVSGASSFGTAESVVVVISAVNDPK